MKERVDLTGRTFGRLYVEKFVGRDKHRHLLWRCVCQCGAVRDVAQWNLLTGNTVSCGCYAAQRASNQLKRHGRYLPKYYSKWHDMMRRCYNTKDVHYDRYGGRGIRVCDEWHDVNKFIDWCESQNPNDGMTIDRIDNDSGYSPDNCRFVSLKDNQNNRSSNRKIEYNGEIKTVSEWADTIGISASTLFSRLDKLHWTVEQALTTPIRKGKHVSELS